MVIGSATSFKEEEEEEEGGYISPLVDQMCEHSPQRTIEICTVKGDTIG